MFLHGILQIKRTYAIMPVGKTIRCVHSSTAKTPQSSHLWGVFIPFWRGGLDLRLATSCYFPSSHLQMQQAITLARMESINDKIEFTIAYPLSVPVQGQQQKHYNMKPWSKKRNFCQDILPFLHKKTVKNQSNRV